MFYYALFLLPKRKEEKSIWKSEQDLKGSYFYVKNEERKVRI